jgi:hypothetical protein
MKKNPFENSKLDKDKKGMKEGSKADKMLDVKQMKKGKKKY